MANLNQSLSRLSEGSRSALIQLAELSLAAEPEADGWLDYNSVVAKIGLSVPPGAAIRRAEDNRRRARDSQGNYRPPEARRYHKDIAKQIQIGQSNLIRNKFVSLQTTGYVDIVVGDCGVKKIRLTPKGWAGSRGEPVDGFRKRAAKKKQPAFQPIPENPMEMFYRVDWDFDMKPNIVAVGADTVVAKQNIAAIQAVLDKAFPGRAKVTLVERPLPDDAA